MENPEITSSENVSPSSPTPQTLRRYNLSMLDQIVPSMLVPLVLYFPTPTPAHPHSFTTNNLKQSLSETLTRFYPLSGRVDPAGHSIDCSDQGVPFTVAQFPSLSLSDLLSDPDEHLPRRRLPCPVAWDSDRCPDSAVAAVRLTHFAGGGVAVGLVFWHKALDAAAAAHFLAAWAAAAREEPHRSPDFSARAIFPPKPEMRSRTGSMSDILKTGGSAARRYAFGPAGRLGSSRVGAASAVIWKAFAAASLANGHAASLLTHAVDLRRRADPNFPPGSFGNFPGLAAAAAENGEVNLEGLVGKMREAVGKIDGEFVRRMMGDGGMEGYLENLRVTWSGIPEKADLLSMSSWCGFGLYGLDFGFGKPGWVTRCDTGCGPGSKFLNVVWLMDTRDGDGVEAWVILDEKYMSVFEGDEDLKALACVNRSPLL